MAITDVEVQDAINFGSSCKNPNAMDAEMRKTYGFEVETSMRMSGRETLMVVTPWLKVAYRACQARTQTRTFTASDARRINPAVLTAVTIGVFIQMAGNGRKPIHNDFNDESALVLSFGGQPAHSVSDKLFEDGLDARMITYPTDTYANTSRTRGDGDDRDATISKAYYFTLTELQRHSIAQAILIDGKGKRHATEINFAKLK